jgi:hypothetical protein
MYNLPIVGMARALIAETAIGRCETIMVPSTVIVIVIAAASSHVRNEYLDGSPTFENKTNVI